MNHWLHIRQEPTAKVSVKVIVSKLFTYKDLLTICSVLEAIPVIKKNFAVLIDQHGGKKQLAGLRDDHHDRMTCSGTRHLLTV